MGIVRLYFHINLINFGPFLPIKKKSPKTPQKIVARKPPTILTFFLSFPTQYTQSALNNVVITVFNLKIVQEYAIIQIHSKIVFFRSRFYCKRSQSKRQNVNFNFKRMGNVRLYFHINLINFGQFLSIQKKSLKTPQKIVARKPPTILTFFLSFPTQYTQSALNNVVITVFNLKIVQEYAIIQIHSKIVFFRSRFYCKRSQF